MSIYDVTQAACIFRDPAARERQRAAQWPTRPPLFINTKVLRGVLIALGVLLPSSVARVRVCVSGRVEGRGKRRGLARSVGCLRSRGGRVWRCVVGAGQAHKPSGRRPLCHLCSCWQRLQPPSHTHKYTGRDRLTSLRSQQTTLWIYTCGLSW